MILIDNKPVYYFLRWHNNNNNNNYVGNLLNADAYILSNEDIDVEHYNTFTVNQMEYNSMLHAIPNQLLHCVQGRTL